MSTRRSACDRCRDQKLRCLRDASARRCRRCDRTDSECTMNPRFRIRNYTGNPTAKRRGDASPGNPGPEALHRYEPPEAPAALDALTSTLTLNTDYSMSASAFSLPLPVSDRLEKWHQNNASLFNFTVFPAASSSARGEAFAESELPSNSMDFEPSPMYAPDGVCAYRAASAFPMALDDDELLQAMPAETPSQPLGVAGDDLQQTPAQKLQHIQSTLSELAAYMQRSFPHSPPLQGVSGIPCLASGPTKATMESILHITNRFLDVLCSMADSQGCPAPTTPSSPTDSPAPPSMGGPASSRDAASSVDSLPVTSPSPAPRPQAYAKAKPDIDITLQLLILTCYIQVLRLFVALLSHIQDYLEEVAGSDDPTLHPVPGLSFSSLPLQSGNLQTTIFIEVIMSLFGRMENILGIPRDLRLCAGGRDHGGMFRDRHFVTLLEVVMRKEEAVLLEPGRNGLGRRGLGGIKALQLGVRGTRQLLSDRINP